MKHLMIFVIVAVAVTLTQVACKQDLGKERASLIAADTACHNTVMALLITPANLKKIIDTPNFSKLYLQFKNTTGTDFSAAAYTGAYPFFDISSYFIPLNQSTPFVPPVPYVLGNLQWNIPPGSQPDMSKAYYLLIPTMADDNLHVTYSYMGIPFSFHYKDSTFNVDSAFIAHANRETQDSLAAYASGTSAIINSQINPVPPKKP